MTRANDSWPWMGWIPGILGFLIQPINSSDWRASKIIRNDIKLEPISWELNLKKPFKFCVGVWVGGHPRANFPDRPKDAHHFTSFDINVVAESDRGKMISNLKLTKNRKLRGLKLRGLRRNQIKTSYLTYQINHRNQVNTISDFENETPTRMSATHTISQIEQKSQNGILKDVSILGTFHWVNSTFLK